MSDPRYRTARWQKLRKRIIARDGGRCAVPSCTTDMAAKRMTQVDHIIEVKDGGGFWDEANLRVVCKPHHDAKTLAVLADRPSGRKATRHDGYPVPGTDGNGYCWLLREGTWTHIAPHHGEPDHRSCEFPGCRHGEDR